VGHSTAVGGASTRFRLASICSTARNGKVNKRPVLEEPSKLPGPTRGKGRTKIAELFADERCSQALSRFLATTDVGRTAGPPVAEDAGAAASEASEWNSRKREERRAALRGEEERHRMEE